MISRSAALFGIVTVLCFASLGCGDDDKDRFTNSGGSGAAGEGGHPAAGSGGRAAGAGRGGSGAKGGAGGSSEQAEAGSGGRAASAGHGGSGGKSGAGTGGAGGAGGQPSAGNNAEENHLIIESFPPAGAESGQAYRYRLLLDQPGTATYELVESPTGAAMDANGIVTWTPTDNQIGHSYDFKVSASLGGATATQDFSVSVTALTLSAEVTVPPDSDQTQVISVSSPLSDAAGVAIMVPPGALDAATAISIGTATGAPPLPGQSGAGETPLVLGLGPSGSVFNSPLDVVVPLSMTAWQKLLQGHGVPSAWTLGAEGRWQSLPVDTLDLDNGYVLLKTQHFSLVSVFAAPVLMTVRDKSTGGNGCNDALFVGAGFSDTALSTFSSSWLNNPGQMTAGSLTDLLNALPSGQRLQLVMRALVVTDTGSYQATRYLVFNLLKGSDNKIDVAVATGNGDVLYKVDDLAPDAAQLASLLGGDFAHFVFRGVPSGESGHLTLDAFGYLRSPDAGLGAPPLDGQAFASLTDTLSGLSAGGDDDDCDGTLNSSDQTPQGMHAPSLSCVGEPTQRVLASTELGLAVKLFATDPNAVALDWISDSPSGHITKGAGGLSATFSSSMPGVHKVMVTAKDAAGTASAVFTVFVDALQTHNTTPLCRISAKQTTVFTGDSVMLEAIPTDAEQSDSELSVSWRTTVGGQLAVDKGRRTAFSAATPATYQVSCVANDGIGDGMRSSISISVIDRPQNSPPKLVFVAPASSTLQLTGNTTAAQIISATAVDVDNDAVSIEFTLLDGMATLSEAPAGASVPGKTNAARRFETTVPGPYSVLVRAVDQNGARSDGFIVKLLVAQSIDSTDADHDGFPASVDCNDQNAKIFPGAPETCGDEIDQDCNGSDRSLGDCDADRDGKSVNAGDCDDANPAVFPGAFERCNGRDDNCDGKADEGFVVGASCKVGVGACTVAGEVVCAASGFNSLCSATPGLPAKETCNGIDDDCNGSVDDVPNSGSTDVNNCGGCGLTCTPGDHQVPACTINATGAIGCKYTCSQGYIDLDRNPANGCELACPNATKEACNGLDDDCDGKVDEDTSTAFYTGPSGTLGVGDCHAGQQLCKNGELVQAVPAVVPLDERCDARDNDCDGKIDETFELGGSCDGPDSDLCANGRRVCNAEGGVGCGLEVKQNLKDVCDSLDNDCNPATPDGSGDAMIGNACDQQNPAFCEPGRIACSAGTLSCSNDKRDSTSCKVCQCDISEACDTNGSGYFCSCDPQCTGPDVDCPCDSGPGCDLLDGAEECGCDKECTGQTACSCDMTPNACDSLPGGFACACDPNCGGSCGCDAHQGTCDKTPEGDSCLCDRDCYPSCPCDDQNPMTCAKDSANHVCTCDPGCEGVPDAGAECACNTTAACDKTPNGDACLCDQNCYPPCPCDDHASTCPHDTNGNACECDPSCHTGSGSACDCDAVPGTCDMDKQTGVSCGCDPDCKGGPSTNCECDKSPGACDQASGGDMCLCDRDCYAGCGCDDHVADTCAKDSDGHPCMCDPSCVPTTAPGCACDHEVKKCEIDSGTGMDCTCDPDCGAPAACTCNTTDVCDKASNGDDCLCDQACYNACSCDDHNPMTCRQDTDGHPCQCDPGCNIGNTGCECNVSSGMCDDDPLHGTGCACDPDCGVTNHCDCDTSNMCDSAKDGDTCFCDPNCYPSCPCADNDPGHCALDSSGNRCMCDQGCDPMPPPSCACNTTDVCDKAANGDACLCDGACYPSCPCDDQNPNTCHTDSEGHACQCDPGCQGGGGTMTCSCNLTVNMCDLDPKTQVPCGCDLDCGAPMNNCACNTHPGVCDTAKDGDACLCDGDCYAKCPCADDDPTHCHMDSAGNACSCDPGCETVMPKPCTCDSTNACDKAPQGDACLCDGACYPGCACDDMNPNTCKLDSSGNACMCDAGCGSTMQPPACDCNLGPGCDTLQGGGTCTCDPECGTTPPPTCNCDKDPNICDKNPLGDSCLCDSRCYAACPCADDNPMTCHLDADGHACTCDPGCEPTQPQTCDCNTTPSCDMAIKGGTQCFCDPSCYPPCTCDDMNPMTCAMDSAGNACRCDPNCRL